MEPKEFILWLDGFLSANPNLTSLSPEQTRRVRDKLSTVFRKVTPNYLDTPKASFEYVMTSTHPLPEPSGHQVPVFTKIRPSLSAIYLGPTAITC